MEIAEIAEVAAYAVPADGGEGMEDEVMIAVMPKSHTQKIDYSTIKTWLKAAERNLPVFAIPRYIRIAHELPKTQTGKIRKVVLRDEGVTQDTYDRSGEPK